MNSVELVNHILADPAALPALVAPLGDTEARALVEHLKAEADRHWWINANRSLELAELIIHIGQARGDTGQIALGTMARGDALKLLGRTEQAWATLGSAGELFQSAGDEVGWARTRIGRLMLCVDLNRVDAAVGEAERARAIFLRHQLPEKRLVLDLNTAIVYGRLGDQRRALAMFQSALAMAEAPGDAGRQWRGPLYTNIGLTYEALGELHQALAFHERARGVWAELGEARMVAIAETNIAIIAMKQGHYRHALALLHRARDLYAAEHLPRDASEVDRIIVECYVVLNRYAEARDLAQQVVAAFHASQSAYEEAITLLHLAAAEAALTNVGAALAALDAAEPIFVALNALAWTATTRLRRGQLALHQHEHETARREALAAIDGFERSSQQVDHAAALLVYSQALLRSGQAADAAHAGAAALQIAQRNNVPALRYTAHLLLGRIAEAQGDRPRAIRRFRAAAATVERVQRGLTITLRPGFLESKAEALDALLAIQLRHGTAEQAFETLERAKSQALLSYLGDSEQLHWRDDDPRSRALIDELNQLREEHQSFYWAAHAAPLGQHSPAATEVGARERRMRAITEQLYLHSADSGQYQQVCVPPLREIQRSLDAGTLLVEFYDDGQQLWAFTVDASSIAVHRLGTSAREVKQLLGQLQLNLAAALKAGSAAPVVRQLAELARRIAQRLYGALLGPLEQHMRGRGRITFVPYGLLHYLPFHMLHTGSQYLIEQYEVVVLPAAALAPRRGPQRRPGALVLAHSLGGELPQTLAEAQLVHDLFGGALYRDERTSRAALRRQPAQLLHIAAHGEHRLDQPEFSYLQLADGQLYADDLLQHDLSYELVTLSGCETGRAKVGGGDELIGLGRGFLYAGAGALITSLWRVADDAAVELMADLYRSLHAGASKAAALRGAQRAALARPSQRHPAFWAAFQLVGDAGPLSHHVSFLGQKEYQDVSLITAL